MKDIETDLNHMIYELWDPVKSIDIIEKLMNEWICVSLGFVI